jgi:hypothetical protein
MAFFSFFFCFFLPLGAQIYKKKKTNAEQGEQRRANQNQVNRKKQKNNCMYAEYTNVHVTNYLLDRTSVAPPQASWVK